MSFGLVVRVGPSAQAPRHATFVTEYLLAVHSWMRRQRAEEARHPFKRPGASDHLLFDRNQGRCGNCLKTERPGS